MRFTASVRGLDLTIGAIGEIGTTAAAGALAGVTKGIDLAELASHKLIDASDHSLHELAEMGHPYAARDPHPPHADPVIHAQTGRYKDALKKTVAKGMVVGGQPTIAGARLAIEGDAELEELDHWLQEGTLTMIPRPWMAEVIKKFGPQIVDIITAEIQRALARAQLAKTRKAA